jgi:hypothetical protein
MNPHLLLLIAGGHRPRSDDALVLASREKAEQETSPSEGVIYSRSPGGLQEYDSED